MSVWTSAIDQASEAILTPVFYSLAAHVASTRIHGKGNPHEGEPGQPLLGPPSSGNLDRASSTSEVLDGRPFIDVQVIDGLSVIEFVNSQYLVDQDVIRALSLQLHHLVEEGRTRILLNFCGVTVYLVRRVGHAGSLHGRLERAQARLGLCGLDPLMRQMIRICHLEPVFDIYADQEEALGAVVERGPDG